VTYDVVVIGAGAAGLSAAVRLAADDYRVLVLEEAPRLGGRATAFTDRDTGERVDNGQHVLFGCYRETYAFLDRIGAADLAPLQPALALGMAGLDGRVHDLRCPAMAPPWHLVAGLLRWRALRVRDRIDALHLRAFISDVRRRGAALAAAGVPASLTVADWLRGHGQGPAIRRWLWDPLAVAALNESPETAAAAPFARVVGELFGPSVADSAIGLAQVPLDELYAEPARRFVERRGGRVATRASARLSLGDGAVRVRADDTDVAPAAVVSAVPWHALSRLWDDRPPAALFETATRAASMRGSPIVTVNLWFDAPVMDRAFVGLVDGPMHWIFDKSRIFKAPAGHLSIVCSAADAIVRLDNREITEAALAQVRRVLPSTRGRTPRRSVVVREPRATFALTVGSPPRPATSTGVPGFFLAGDWVATGLPGTIESAVVSGHAAAAAAAALIAGRRGAAFPRIMTR